MIVDTHASYAHYVERIAPVWHALPKGERGTVSSSVEARLTLLARGVSGGDRHGDVGLAAGWSDALALRTGHKVALMEHGVGQTYHGSTEHHPAYAGGEGRGFIRAFLCPNERVRKLNAVAYPDAICETVGDVFMDDLDLFMGHYPEYDVAVSFHPDFSSIAPEAGSSRRHYADAVRTLSQHVKVLGHSHPRDRNQADDWFASIGVEHAYSFSRVVTACRVLVCDNSSIIYYASALGLPVVLLNSPRYRRHIEHGLRFWEYADIGWQVDEPKQLLPAVEDALSHPQRHADRAAEVSAALFPLRDGRSAERIADVLRAVSCRAWSTS